jgi:hypothetical protein
MNKYEITTSLCFLVGVITAWIATHYPSIWDNYFNIFVAILILLIVVSTMCVFKIQKISLSDKE